MDTDEFSSETTTSLTLTSISRITASQKEIMIQHLEKNKELLKPSYCRKNGRDEWLALVDKLNKANKVGAKDSENWLRTLKYYKNKIAHMYKTSSVERDFPLNKRFAALLGLPYTNNLNESNSLVLCQSQKENTENRPSLGNFSHQTSASASIPPSASTHIINVSVGFQNFNSAHQMSSISNQNNLMNKESVDKIIEPVFQKSPNKSQDLAAAILSSNSDLIKCLETNFGALRVQLQEGFDNVLQRLESLEKIPAAIEELVKTQKAIDITMSTGVEQVISCITNNNKESKNLDFSLSDEED